MLLSTRCVAALALGLLFSGLPACKPSSSTPEDALRGFLGELKNHRASEAFQHLSSESQAALKKDAQALAEATHDPVATDPAKLLFERSEVILLRQPESISVASRPGDAVMLRVSVENGESANVRMVREGTAWKVDLMGSLTPREDKPKRVKTGTTAE
ncbi:MAG: hypothetical protein U1E65_26685 [Myxococcota bacterium]